MKSNSLKKPVNSLPFKCYFDNQIFQKEIGKIFNTEWIYFCHTDSLKPKHYRTLKIDNKNIVIIKDHNEKISVFYNTCMHRGSQIFDKDEGSV